MATTDADVKRSGLLEGLRVVEIAGPDPATAYAGKLLAQLGADVVCVESPDGSPLRRMGPFLDDVPDRERSGAFFAFNVNKRGVTLNLGTATGVELLDQLLRTTDILLFGLDEAERTRL